MRSHGTADPRTSPGAVHNYTADAGPEGVQLKKKYTQGIVTKSTRQKGSGNSGNCGRAFRRYQRGHFTNPSQVPAEERARRVAQGTSDRATRSAE